MGVEMSTVNKESITEAFMDSCGPKIPPQLRIIQYG